MRNYFPVLCLGVVLAFGLTTPAKAGSGEMLGLVTGAGTGGYLGSMIGHGSGRWAATGAGVVVGGYVGDRIGSSFDQPHYQPVYTTLDSGYYAPSPYDYYDARPVYVPNYVAAPDIPPPPSIRYDEDNGGYCREYSQQVRIGNRVQESYGTACLQPDGTWRVVQ